jgi:hypothetical protein
LRTVEIFAPWCLWWFRHFRVGFKISLVFHNAPLNMRSNRKKMSRKSQMENGLVNFPCFKINSGILWKSCPFDMVHIWITFHWCKLFIK